VLTPRYAHQADAIARRSWTVAPIVVDHPVPFVPLLLGVDAVMSSGGTMLREAAYLGLPAYSTFRSELGAVDRRLSDTGRVRLIADAADLDTISFAPRGEVAPTAGGAELVDDLVRELKARA